MDKLFQSLIGRRADGQVMRMSEKGDYGFVQADDVPELAGYELFFHQKAVVSKQQLAVRDYITFTLAADRKRGDRFCCERISLRHRPSELAAAGGGGARRGSYAENNNNNNNGVNSGPGKHSACEHLRALRSVRHTGVVVQVFRDVDKEKRGEMRLQYGLIVREVGSRGSPATPLYFGVDDVCRDHLPYRRNGCYVVPGDLVEFTPLKRPRYGECATDIRPLALVQMNAFARRRFFLSYVVANERVPLEEDRNTEFKSLTRCETQSSMLTQLHSIVERYMNAFLNTDGGHLFFGVADNGVALGLMLDTSMRDLFRRRIDEVVKKMQPPPTKDMYEVAFIPVYERPPAAVGAPPDVGIPIADACVVEIYVARGDILYETANGEALRKLEGSVCTMDRKAKEEKYNSKRASEVASEVEKATREMQARFDERLEELRALKESMLQSLAQRSPDPLRLLREQLGV